MFINYIYICIICIITEEHFLRLLIELLEFAREGTAVEVRPH